MPCWRATAALTDVAWQLIRKANLQHGLMPNAKRGYETSPADVNKAIVYSFGISQSVCMYFCKLIDASSVTDADTDAPGLLQWGMW